MILVLNIKNSDKGAWQIYQDKQIIFSHEFAIVRGEDQSLLHLDDLLKKHNIKLANIKGLILLVKEASLTQVKVLTTTVNVLAWQLNVPIVGEYYYKGQEDKVLGNLVNKISKLKKFKALSPKYSNKKVITISKKQAKYKISK